VATAGAAERLRLRYTQTDEINWEGHMTDVHTVDWPAPAPASCFSLMALVLLGTRFVQGFIFWGGASLRLFYDFHEIDGVAFAVKLNFESAGFVANKLTYALVLKAINGATWKAKTRS
jgi:hypothetical protein